MKTVIEMTAITHIVEKSEFIAVLFHLNDEKQLKVELESLKKKYPKARHYCYAVKIKDFSKSSDDGEPKGTAGRPMIELLNKHQLDMVMLVVIRYFGGVKLGAGRLLRTYVEAASNVIEKSAKYDIINMHSCEVVLNYGDYEYLNSKLESLNAKIESIEFSIDVKVVLLSINSIDELLLNLLGGNAKIRVLDKKEHYMKVEETI